MTLWFIRTDPDLLNGRKGFSKKPAAPLKDRATSIFSNEIIEVAAFVSDVKQNSLRFFKTSVLKK